MKKTILLLLVLLSWHLVLAEVVTEKQALQRASDFFATADVKTKASAVRPEDFKLVGTFPEAATKSPSSAPAMYIFERSSGGYAIVSGDDVARPVLGYSLSGRFPITDIPDNTRALLQWYADIIDFARQQHWAASPMASANGLDPANTVKLQTALWSQYSPFNDLVPEINGQKPPIGCVATAFAIVMRYHKWPKKGTGTLPSYDYSRNGENYHVEGFDLGHEYDWDKMPENYRNCSEEEAAQIARLLYDIAVFCKMIFYPGGSGADGLSASVRLPTFFNYDKRIHYYLRKDLSDRDWEQQLVDEINAGRPVVYGGGSPEGAHAFVIDGYNGRYFSINYGWGGAANGWYTVTPVIGHEDDMVLYYLGQDMVCGMMPDEGGIPTSNLVSDTPIELPNSFAIGKDFHLSQAIYNQAYGHPTVDFCYMLYDRNSSIKERISTSVDTTESYGYGRYAYSVSSSCRISSVLEEGDMIALAVKESESGEWKQVLHPRMDIVEFTGRPLSDLIEIGYVEEPKRKDPDRKSEFFLKVYKDIVWDLCGNTPYGYGAILESSNAYKGALKEVISYRYYLQSDGYSYSQTVNNECDTFVYEIWLPLGEYVLHFRNPLTNEQMEINLEL